MNPISNQNIYSDQIGFLPYDKPIIFSNVKIKPLNNFENVADFINKNANRDGFYYPPQVHSVNQKFKQVGKKIIIEEEPIENSNRPARLFKLPPSHKIEVYQPFCVNDPKKGDGLFLTHFTAFFFGINLQFHDWLFDNRVPISIGRDFYADHNATESFLNISYDTWKNLDAYGRDLITNLLFMFSRVRSYEWDWEQFTISYMIFDGCYKYLSKYHGVNSRTHSGRFYEVINHLMMKFDQNGIDQIVKLRNNLFHETLWEGGNPCNSGTTNSYASTLHLKNLNCRIISAILGYNGEYISSPWWKRDVFKF